MTTKSLKLGLDPDLYYQAEFPENCNLQMKREVNTLLRTRHKLIQLRNQLLSSTSTMNNKLMEMTNQAWHPDMDTIMNRNGFSLIHSDLKSFQNFLAKNLSGRNRTI